MKPVYVVILMGSAAIGGGLVVRYASHPVQVAQARSTPPAVIAPPIPPTVHMGPSNSVPVRSARPEPPEASAAPPEKPSALSLPVHVGKPEKPPADPAPPRSPTIVARVRIPPEAPAVIPLERSFVPTPAPHPVPEPKQPASTSPPPAEPNRATLRSGMLIAVRINEALSSNLNSPGDVFSGTLEKPLIADGFVIAERGARVRGEVVESTSAARGQGSSELAIRLREILASDGQRVHIVSQPWRRDGGAYNGSNPSGGVYDAALTRGGAAVIRPATSITFRLDENVELTEKH